MSVRYYLEALSATSSDGARVISGLPIEPWGVAPHYVTDDISVCAALYEHAPGHGYWGDTIFLRWMVTDDVNDRGCLMLAEPTVVTRIFTGSEIISRPTADVVAGYHASFNATPEQS